MSIRDAARLRLPHSIRPGRIRHEPREHICHHRHEDAFLAVVLEGRYIEAGDTGYHRLGPGDVIFHRRWESHLNDVDTSGATVLVLPVVSRWTGVIRGRIVDPDGIAKLAELDPLAAVTRVAQTIVEQNPGGGDWPALLATRLRREPETRLDDWARAMGLHPGSLARGFRQAFGVTPAEYRLAQKTHRALNLIQDEAKQFSAIAAEAGFADQPHMIRRVKQATGLPPAALRSKSRSARLIATTGGQ